MRNQRLKKTLLFTLFNGCVLSTSVVQANSVSLNVQNSTPEVLQLVSSSPSGVFPATVGPGQSLPVSYDFGGTSSEMGATYKRVGTGTTCRFSASHAVYVSGPRFAKNAVSTGATSATCLTFQSPTWRIPYNYTATFAFYY